MTTLLRWLVRASRRLYPVRLRDRFEAEWAETVGELAREARARGRRAERAYLLRELADSVRDVVTLRREGATTWRALAASVGETVRHEVRAGLRRCARRPAATAGVVVTLAVVVAAVTTTFGLAHAVLWKPLPYPNAERLVFLWEEDPAEPGPFRVTAGRFTSWVRHAQAFDGLALFGAAGHSMDDAGGSVPVRGLRVSSSYFDTLGVRPMMGRAFFPEDEVPGQDRVLLISEGMWRARFGGTPDIIGRQVRLSGEPFTVVGVMPGLVSPGWPSNPAHVAIEYDLREFWVPIARTPALESNIRSHVFGVVGRLKPDVSIAQATAALRALAARDAEPHAGVVTPYREQLVRDARTPLLVLLMASIAVLLVACANLAAVQVSLVERQLGELAMRLALGAGRLRLALLLGTDAAVAAACGLALGVWLSGLALAGIPHMLPPSMPFLTAPDLDVTVALIACGVAAATAIALAVWPVARLQGVSPAPRGATTSGRGAVYRWLVASQVAVGVALAVPAALLGQSLAAIRARDAGFVVEGVAVVDLAVSAAMASDRQRVSAFERDALRAINGLPGVRGAAFAYDHPLEANWMDRIELLADQRTESAPELQVQLRIVSPGYFEAMSVDVLDGRAFEDRDDGHSPGVVVVNESFAAGIGGRVVGRRITSAAAQFTWGPTVPSEYAVVGVVEDERFRGLDQASAPAVYVSSQQFPLTAASVLVRTEAGHATWAGNLRQALGRVDPEATIGRIAALEAILAEQLAARRVTADVVTAFALAAVALAALGLYGLLAVTVAARSREVGVRLALGASPAEVARGIVRASLAPALLGVMVGLALALAMGRFVRHLLVDVSDRDPRTLGAIAFVMLVVAVAAAVVPARRAARIDPASALRAEP